MTGLLLAAALQQGPEIIEIADPKAERIVIQAVVKTPFALGQRESAVWSALSRLTTTGGQDFTPFELMQAASHTGFPPRVSAEGGLLRMQFVAPAGDLDLACHMAESLVLHPYLTEKDGARLIAGAREAGLSGLGLAYQPEWMSFTGTLAGRPLSPELLSDLYRLAVQPGNLTLLVRGPFAPGAAQAELARRFDQFPAPPRRSPARYDPLPRPRTTREDGLASAELRGKAVSPKDPSFPALVAATAALGTGKEASVFRVLRQKLRLSYEQSCFLWPTREGWLPRLIVIQKQRPDSKTLASRTRDAILADIEAWKDSDLTRAKSMVKTAMGVGLPDGPLWLGAQGAAGSGLEDRTALAALFAACGADPGLVDSLAAKATEVTLDQMKKAARQAVSGGDFVMSSS